MVVGALSCWSHQFLGIAHLQKYFMESDFIENFAKPFSSIFLGPEHDPSFQSGHGPSVGWQYPQQYGGDL